MTSVAQRIPEIDLLPKVLSFYGVRADNDEERSRFVAKHLDELERAENEAIARTGFVLRRSHEGFGLGYKVPLAIIAIGHAMLGVDLAVVTPLLASNPAAFTCAAVGAVYYGYQAMTDHERTELHRRVGEAIGVGIELIRSIAEFCITTLKTLLDTETMAKLKTAVAEAAAYFGTSLASITGSFADKLLETAHYAAGKVTGAGSVIGTTAASIYGSGKALVWQPGDQKPE